MEFLKEFMQKAQEESKEDDVPDLKEGEDFENVADQD